MPWSARVGSGALICSLGSRQQRRAFIIGKVRQARRRACVVLISETPVKPGARRIGRDQKAQFGGQVEELGSRGGGGVCGCGVGLHLLLLQLAEAREILFGEVFVERWWCWEGSADGPGLWLLVCHWRALWILGRSGLCVQCASQNQT